MKLYWAMSGILVYMFRSKFSKLSPIGALKHLIEKIKITFEIKLCIVICINTILVII